MAIMYIVLEIQKFSATQIAITTPIYSSSNRNAAESEYHRLCSIAAISSVPRHTVIMMDDMGVLYTIQSYEHEQEEEA